MEDGETPLIQWVRMNTSTANILSIVMLVFAAWAGIEILSNVSGGEIPPVTGAETNDDPDDSQRFNNGWIVGLGAIAFSFGLTLQLIIPRGDLEDKEIESTPDATEEETVTYNEELVKLTKWLCARGTTTAQFFEWADSDGSGTIDIAEFADALRTAEIANLPPWDIEELISIMDINSDGKINLPELDITIMSIRGKYGIDFIPYVESDEVEDEVKETEDSTLEEIDSVVSDAEINETTEDNDAESADDVVETEGEIEPTDDQGTEADTEEDVDQDDAADDSGVVIEEDSLQQMDLSEIESEETQQDETAEEEDIVDEENESESESEETQQDETAEEEDIVDEENESESESEETQQDETAEEEVTDSNDEEGEIVEETPTEEDIQEDAPVEDETPKKKKKF